jgi:hypothetical protein
VPLAAAGLVWQVAAAGVWRAEAPMAAKGPLATVRVVALRLDPRQVRFELVSALRDQSTRGAWTVDSLPPTALAGFNAGQFTGPIPWGWLVRDGHEVQPPGAGALAMAFMVDDSGRVELLRAQELGARRSLAAEAFQSYPALLVGRGERPRELEGAGRGVNLEHRDSRLALGVLEDGSVLVALTRFTGLGPAGEQLPWGPTVGEMAAWMRARGCRRAVLLDGGMSGQLAVRAGDGTLTRWPNWRPVPLGMLVMPREHGLAGASASQLQRAR